MSYFDALLLALLQGVTEFLPISSSGHLILAQHFLGSSGDVDLLYDLLLHVATAVAVLTYFRRDIIQLWDGLAQRPTLAQGVFAGREREALQAVFLTLIPTAGLGILIEHYFLSTLIRPEIVGGMLFTTGCLLWWGRGRTGNRSMAEMRPTDALAIGLLQGVAIVPGISRAGATITAGFLLGFERELAVRFSMLISVPTILGATCLEVSKLYGGPLPPLGPYVAGMALAAVVGYLSIALILRVVRQDHFHLFAWYLWPVGIVVILGSSFA